MADPPITDNLQFYFRSDVGTFQDTAGSTPASSDSDSVARWNDARGGEPYLFQSTSGSRPTLQTNEINGLPCLRFDGTNDFFIFSHRLIPVTRTMYAVVKVPGTGVYTLLAGSTSSLQWRIDNLKQRYVDANVADIGSSTTGISSGTWSQINASWDIPTRGGVFRSNKAADGTVTGASGVDAEQPILGFGRKFVADVESFATDIALLMLYYGIHTTGERQSIENWITSEFGV